MIVSCPVCQTRYRVDLATLGAAGRKVRCRRCRHVWHQPPEAPKPAPKPQAKAKPAAKAPPPPPPPPEPPSFMDELPAEPLLEPLPEDDLPPPLTVDDDDAFEAFRARRRASLEDMGVSLGARRFTTDDYAPQRGSRLALISLVVLLTLIGGGVYGFITQRDLIARTVPETAAIYAYLAHSLDMPDLAVNVRGLAFVGVKQSRGYEGKDPYVGASGTIVNVTNSEIEVPPIRIALHDENKHQVLAQLAKPQQDKLGPNMSTRFGARIAHVPADAKFIEWSFARPEEVAAASEAPAGHEEKEKPAAAQEEKSAEPAAPAAHEEKPAAEPEKPAEAHHEAPHHDG